MKFTMNGNEVSASEIAEMVGASKAAEMVEDAIEQGSDTAFYCRGNGLVVIEF